MNNQLNLLRCFLTLGFLIAHCYAQDFRFEQLSQENILDKQPVLSIAQDQKGRLWFGGADNLFVYDSKNISNLLKSDTSLNDIKYIIKIGINIKNDLFIGTDTHLYVYDINKQRPVKKNNKIFKEKIAVLDIQTLSNQTFICAQNGLYMAKPEGSSYRLELLLSRSKVQTITQINSDTYIIASLQGIEVLEYKNEKLSIVSNLQLPISLREERIVSSLLYDKSNLWVATKLHGVYRYKFSNKEWVNFSVGNSNLLSNNIRKIIKNPAGNILIGTLKGLSVFQKENHFNNYQHNTLNYSLSQNSIYDIFIDNQKIVWLGTYFGGINAIYPNILPLIIYSTRSSNFHRLNSDITSSYAQTKNSYWIGTEENGINIIDKQSGYSVPVPHLTKSNLIKDLYVRDNKIYAAQYAGGYNVMDIYSHKTDHYYLDKDSFNVKNNVFTIYVDLQHKIYLGTNTGLFTVEKNQIPIRVDEIGSTEIADIQEDRKNQIYLLQENKLYVKKQNSIFKVIPELKSYSIKGFFIDHLDQLWFTTDSALYSIQKNGKTNFEVKFKKNNLGWPIRIDNKLWITSKNGLIFFNPKTKYTTILNQNDGLPVKNLQNAKLFHGEEGKLFLTTLNGLVSIDTRKIVFNHIAPTVLLRNIYVNESILPFDRISATATNNHYQIRLHHHENYLTIDFSSSNFIKPLKNKYRYKLDGIDKYWIETNSANIKYTNIPEGRHKLTIFSCNNDMIWSKTPLILDIMVLPPFWRTWWAYLFYAISFALAIHFIIKFIVEREILINSEKEHEKKIKFFTQISHEIRTPLTLITAPLDELITEVATLPTTQFKLIRIKKNATKLLSVINELLDFKKFDDNKQELKLTSISFREYIEDTFYLFNDLAQTKNLNYYIKRIDPVGIQLIDTIQFDKVMFNLLSNAIKYTPENGTVYLEILHDEKNITIHIVDNGVGITSSNQFKIFEEYYREDHVQDSIGTGIGLALTKKIIEQHGGEIYCRSNYEKEELWTIFTVRLPITANLQYHDHEKSNETNYSLNSIPSITETRFQTTILIVEDNKELLELIASIFKENFNVILAHDGEEALKKAEKNVPDLIISDLMMPNMNGSELCKTIKRNIITSHIPFILLTALTDDQVQTETLQSGANIYLTKPFNNSQLFYYVQNLLNINKKRSQNFQIKTTISDNEQDNKFIQSLNKLIEDHLLSDSFDVNYISRAMAMSAPVLYRKLNAITNLSLNNYVKNYRLNKAKEMLISTMNISEVAYAVGFSDRKYFSKEFKKLFGQNPSEFIIKEQRESN
ncbi:response regulator [Sphingobacterium faecium]|uniref:response regulator n=1 Tax=Sphingobacterium faecium TaxID=34087 RepID=UPI000D3DC6AE|nr:response regulator [Sphingobacterium faecium]PTX10834.1 two component regulator with propeller domain [Sphingobacterium faecium]